MTRGDVYFDIVLSALTNKLTMWLTERFSFIHFLGIVTVVECRRVSR